MPRSRRDEESNRQSTGNRNRDRSALRLDRRLEDRISVTDRLETKQTYQRRVRNVQRDRAFEDKYVKNILFLLMVGNVEFIRFVTDRKIIKRNYP